MARCKSLVTKRSRQMFGEPLDAFDRGCLARTVANVDAIPVAGLRNFTKTVVEVLWGIGFANHSRRRRGVGAQEAKVCPERVAQLAWGIYYGSWLAKPAGVRGHGAGAGR